MDDLSASISKVLSDPESLRQLQQMAASLGLSGNGQQGAQPLLPPAQNSPQGGHRQPPLNWTMGGGGRSGTRRQNQPAQQRKHEPSQSESDTAYIKSMLEQLVENTRPPPSTPIPTSPGQGGGFDMSALSGILSGLGANAQRGGMAAPPEQNQGAGLDLSALSGILSGLGAGAQGNGVAASPDQSQGAGLDLSALSGILGGLSAGQESAAGPDLSSLSGMLGGLIGSGNKQADPSPSGVSALTAMLGGGEGQGSGAGPLGGMNMDMLLKFQQAMSSLSTSGENVRLMMALKGQLKDESRIAKVDDAVKVMQVVQFLPILKESGIFGKLEEIMDSVNLGGLLGGSQSQGGGLGNILSGLTQGSRGGGLPGILGSLAGRR